MFGVAVEDGIWFDVGLGRKLRIDVRVWINDGTKVWNGQTCFTYITFEYEYEYKYSCSKYEYSALEYKYLWLEYKYLLRVLEYSGLSLKRKYIEYQ